MMTCDTDWEEFYKKWADAELFDCALCIVARCLLRLFLQRFFINLFVMLSIATIGVTPKYVLMRFKVLLLTIYLNTGALSKSYE